MVLQRSQIFAALLCFLLQEGSWSWTTNTLTVTQRMSSQQQQRHAIFQRMSLVGNACSEESTEGSSNASSSSNSRRRWLGNVGAMAAAALGVSTTTSLPSYAELAVVSSSSVCDPTVSVWSKDGRIIYLLGTAHISSTSAALAGQLVRDTNPKGVFIELDPKRVSGTGSLAQKFQGDSDTPAPTRASNIIVPQISAVPGDGGMVLTSSSSSSSPGEAIPPTAISPATKKEMNNPIMKAATAAVGKQIKGLYSRLDSAGFDSGEEFVTAVKEGKKIGADIVLGDRDVEVTLRRVTEGLAKTDLKAFLSPDSELERTMQGMLPVNEGVADRMAGSSSSDAAKDLSDEQFKEELTSFVETMKTKENVRLIMGQLQRLAPFLYEALVSERDVYMATGLNGLNELESIVAVVGIAHADGIEKSLQMNGWKAANPSCAK
uniref:Uncharacterized protein n=1 Tax=Pseudo-nitzschia australis TaxID=44445 RepID=A0A6V0CCG5_9STRA|mmetsp:Transcript_10094/g.21366  ORF Transcript_10094/g.21366 Transcript_10094/m.21366 type:complete len:433 (+) Transcript_10094:153-1451(+)|eukprot:CAMPEP_0168204210 /NCGR_PEP_ID=MMETSP0139_2-20121125/25273_1 /TAXON_ID=44445 /ORGANISM="Pseudo-nitzschia australis, Strain 10249 10 AB" /LENGTH=432 /DNA_ID=CAMNT_0008130127 /DNA_START=95 /DNA_END=1393 /DNA_ORIENTATION=-